MMAWRDSRFSAEINGSPLDDLVISAMRKFDFPLGKRRSADLTAFEKVSFTCLFVRPGGAFLHNRVSGGGRGATTFGW